MVKRVSKQDFLNLLENKSFQYESDIRNMVVPKLSAFLRVTDEQVEEQVNTTTFSDNSPSSNNQPKYPKNSERADIVIWSRNEHETIRRALVVIELKLNSSVTRFHAGSYKSHEHKLHKYCQDIGAPYSVLLSDRVCKFFRYKLDSAYEEVEAIPYPAQVEGQVTRRLLRSFFYRDQSLKYFIAGISIIVFLYVISSAVVRILVDY